MSRQIDTKLPAAGAGARSAVRCQDGCADSAIALWPLAALILLLAVVDLEAQAPVLRSHLATYTARDGVVYSEPVYVLLLAYVGTTPQDARLDIWTTNSMSPNATIGAPFDTAGEAFHEVAVANVPAIGADGAPIPGWVMIPVKQVKIFLPSMGQWIYDQHMRIVVQVTTVPGCGVACGSVLLLPRTALAMIQKPLGAPSKRRGVAP